MTITLRELVNSPDLYNDESENTFWLLYNSSLDDWEEIKSIRPDDTGTNYYKVALADDWEVHASTYYRVILYDDWDVHASADTLVRIEKRIPVEVMNKFDKNLKDLANAIYNGYHRDTLSEMVTELMTEFAKMNRGIKDETE